MAPAIKNLFRAAIDHQKAAVAANDCTVCDLPETLGERVRLKFVSSEDQILNVTLDLSTNFSFQQ